MSDKGRGTRDEAEDRAAEAYTRTLKLIGRRPGEILIKGQAFRQGFWRGYEAAEAAERERIIAALGAVMKDESLMDAYDEGYNDGLAKAIEIVKGGDER